MKDQPPSKVVVLTQSSKSALDKVLVYAEEPVKGKVAKIDTKTILVIFS